MTPVAGAKGGSFSGGWLRSSTMGWPASSGSTSSFILWLCPASSSTSPFTYESARFVHVIHTARLWAVSEARVNKALPDLNRCMHGAGTRLDVPLVQVLLMVICPDTRLLAARL